MDDTRDPKRDVTIVEVGPRDGFQIERRFIPTALKIELIEGLIDAGLPVIEVTSFVSPKAVPQLADAAEVVAGIRNRDRAELLALVPNLKGAERAIAAGVDSIGLVVSASESHNAKNVNRTVDRSLAGFADVVATARAAGVDVKGGIATSFGCPFEGDVPVAQVVRIARRYAELGITRIGLADTTGMAQPKHIKAVVRAVRAALPEADLGLHLHNTRGLGLVNAHVGLEEGIRRLDASVAGLGGCPFAPAATGNICTDDLVFMLEGLDLATGVDLDRLLAVARRVEEVIGRALPGQVMKAGTRAALHPLEAVRTAAG
ncbi:MAG: hydroxymethylglutaryl-CoA lyase [Deinococcus-Thermus bacterium]|jgi:hydroxymethylglutaryl-CoA lyase|nr:hydroxymethylglutaryl-CoA lyase [Deinococcota bacterium]